MAEVSCDLGQYHTTGSIVSKLFILCAATLPNLNIVAWLCTVTPYSDSTGRIRAGGRLGEVSTLSWGLRGTEKNKGHRNSGFACCRESPGRVPTIYVSTHLGNAGKNLPLGDWGLGMSCCDSRNLIPDSLTQF